MISIISYEKGHLGRCYAGRRNIWKKRIRQRHIHTHDYPFLKVIFGAYKMCDLSGDFVGEGPAIELDPLPHLVNAPAFSKVPSNSDNKVLER